MENKKKFLASHFKLYVNKCNYNAHEDMMKEFLEEADLDIMKKIESDYIEQEIDLTPENFIYYSISIFNDEEKKRNGITYTPLKTAELMIKLSLELLGEININSFKVVDPAVGGGIFLVLILRKLRSEFDISIKSLIENNLFGVDVVSENVLLTKLALVLVCLENKSDLPKKINIIEYDSFKLNEENKKNLFGANKFDLIITNPPYIRSKNLSKEAKDYIKTKFTTVHGITDTYIPFFEIVVELLNSNKVGTLITPNSFFTSLNGKKLRKYLISNCKEIKLINFNSEKIFNGVSSYSAITCFVKKSNTSEQCRIKYLSNSIENYINNENKQANWEKVSQAHTWRTLSLLEKQIINKLEDSFKLRLKDLNFKNGIATQRNNIYSFVFEKEREGIYKFYKDELFYEIEKGITRPFITPNKKNQIENQRIIFPYEFNEQNGKNEIISELEMKKTYPLAYSYLLKHKKELSKRATDKNIPAWYAYGRSQGLNDFDSRLYIPYMAQELNTIISKNTDEIFAAGYAIFDEDTKYLELLDSILTSKLFTFYIAMVSKPYSKNYYSTAKNLIKYFSIPPKNLLKNGVKSKLNESQVFDLYGLSNKEVQFVKEFVNQL